MADFTITTMINRLVCLLVVWMFLLWWSTPRRHLTLFEEDFTINVHKKNLKETVLAGIPVRPPRNFSIQAGCTPKYWETSLSYELADSSRDERLMQPDGGDVTVTHTERGTELYTGVWMSRLCALKFAYQFVYGCVSTDCLFG